MQKSTSNRHVGGDTRTLDRLSRSLDWGARVQFKAPRRRRRACFRLAALFARAGVYAVLPGP